MSERDELALAIEGHWVSHYEQGFELGSGDAEDIAETLLAAGYRKPRTITTAEELDALGTGTIILEGASTCWVKVRTDRRMCWGTVNEDERASSYSIKRPAIVLWEPR